MVSSRCAIIALVAALAASSVNAEADSPKLRGGGSTDLPGPGQMLFRIDNKAPFPVSLASCGGNVTLSTSQEATLKYTSLAALANVSFFWVVPEGAAFDCNEGCPDCWYVAFGLEERGGLVMRIGFMAETDGAEDGGEEQRPDDGTADGADNETQGSEAEESENVITGMKLFVIETTSGTRQSSVCGQDFCSPDWERDHAVAWNSTVDLVIEGAREMDGIESQPGHMLLLRRGFRGGRGFRGRGFRGPRRWGRRFGPRRVIYRPPIWRRPVWRRPVYPIGACYFCSGRCWWLCR